VADGVLETAVVDQEEARCSEAHVASEAPEGITNSHTDAE